MARMINSLHIAGKKKKEKKKWKKKKKKISLEIFSEGKKRSLKGEYIKVYKITGGVGGR